MSCVQVYVYTSDLLLLLKCTHALEDVVASGLVHTMVHVSCFLKIDILGHTFIVTIVTTCMFYFDCARNCLYASNVAYGM